MYTETTYHPDGKVEIRKLTQEEATQHERELGFAADLGAGAVGQPSSFIAY